MSEVVKFTVLGVDKSQKALQSIGKNLKKTAVLAVKFSAGAAAATTAIVAFTNKIASNIDTQVKFASRIGVSIEELTTYQYVADRAGISTEQFNMSVQRMTRRVSEAAQGTGEAQNALKELNIDAKSFSGLGLDQQMEVLADKMGNVGNESDRLRLAFKLFDSEGTSMLQMLNGGSDAMRKTARDAQFLGLAISKQAGANAEAFKDSMTRVGGALKGVSNSIAGELMPILTGLGNRLANFIAKNKDSIVAFAKSAVENLVIFGQISSQVFTRFKKIFTDLSYMKSFLVSLSKLPAMVGNMLIQLGKSIAVTFHSLLEGIGVNIIEFAMWAKDAINPFSDAGSLSDRMAKSFEFALNRAKSRISETIGETADFASTVFEDAAGVMGDAFGIDLDFAKEKAQQAIESISEFGVVSGEKLQEAASLTNEVLSQTKDDSQIFWEEQMDWANTFSESFYETMSSTIDSISNGMATLVVQGGSFMKVMKSIAKSVLQQVITALIKMGIQRVILGKINSVATKSEASAEAAKAVGMATANGIASWAAAPWPINMGAPAFGASMGAAASAGFASGAAAGAALGGSLPVAHGGLTKNPEEQTFLLRRGERVLSPDQNSDLTGFLNNSGQEQRETGTNQVIIENLSVSVLENATNAEAIFDMEKDEISRMLADPIIDALNNQEQIGILPNFIERIR